VFDPSRRSFYSQFVERGDLVFDVGANVGDYAQALLTVGAKVVAIEPDPRNLGVLKKRFGGKNVVIEPCAMGEREGSADLHIAREKSDRSTLSTLWAKNAECSELVKVPLSTLDVMAKRHGLPKYVKIDAEGYDAEVLLGMSFRPEMVSFEYAPGDLSVATRCVELLSGYTFNFALGEKAKFELDRWATEKEIIELLSAVPTSINYGDVFGKKQRQLA
jgi:FkbM family methyltransferase